MKTLLLSALAGALLCTPVLAQPLAQVAQGQGQNNGNFGAGGGATFQLPPSVQNVVSIDALNIVIIASDGEQPGQTRYTPTRIQHVYSGGIARLFGGSSVPTAQFATPGAMNNNGNGNGGFGNNNAVAANGGNNQNGGFGGNQNGFGGGGFQNNGGGFGGGGFGGNGFGGFQTGMLQGNGFDTQGLSAIVNARMRAR